MTADRRKYSNCMYPKYILLGLEGIRILVVSKDSGKASVHVELSQANTVTITASRLGLKGHSIF